MTMKTKSVVDGIPRTVEDELILNQLMQRVLATEDGQKMLDYLRSLSLDTYAPAETSPYALFYLEGMRRMVSIMINRAKRGKVHA